MRRLIFALVCAVALIGPAASASATTLAYGDQYFIGYYGNPEPASLTDEMGYVNFLIDVVKGTTDFDSDNRFYSREDSSLNGPFDPVVLAGSQKTDTNVNTGIDVTGFTYLVAKYDGPNGAALVWLVSGLDTVDIPAKWGPDNKTYGLSHYSLFNPTTCVPDGGATLMLLGGALVGLGALRRKFGR